jgi:hypothetical protein
LVELNEMMAAHVAYEEHFADVIAFGVNYGFSGKKPRQTRRNVAAEHADLTRLRQMMNEEIPGEPVMLTKEVVETVFAKDIIGATKLDITPPPTAPEEDLEADKTYLLALDKAIKTRAANREN